MPYRTEDTLWLAAHGQQAVHGDALVGHDAEERKVCRAKPGCFADHSRFKQAVKSLSYRWGDDDLILTVHHVDGFC
jgi:hypothetical protein